MKVQTNMAEALTKASFDAANRGSKTWIARQVADRLQYTVVGQKPLERATQIHPRVLVHG